VSVLAVVGFGPFDMSWLATALVLTTPILFAAIGELASERAGVLNVGLEGMMLSGAFFSFLIADKTDSILLGAVAGVAAGLGFAIIMALLAVEAGADQIVSGVGINLAAVGLTSYLFDQIYQGSATTPLNTIGPLKIPGLASIPSFGKPLFQQDPLVYLAFLLVPLTWFVLYRTRWGLAVRASGELPAAADTAGISVRRVRWAGTLTAGALAGLGGSYLVIVDVGIFHQEMTAGRGFLALVAVIFGRWTPLGVFGACLALGATDALQLRLADHQDVPDQVWGAIAVVAVIFLLYQVFKRRLQQHRTTNGGMLAVATAGFALFAIAPNVSLPAQLWRSLPYLLALLVLAGALSRARMPSHLTLPYRRGEG
jgi:general nucleoside transport system permease protein